MIDTRGVLMIEPTQPATAEPKVDYWTYWTAMVYEATTPSSLSAKGWHTCVCGADSDNKDHVLPDGRITNSLAVHYMAYHRDEVPSDEIFKIDVLFKTTFPEFDFNAFDADTDRQRELVAAIPAPTR